MEACLHFDRVNQEYGYNPILIQTCLNFNNKLKEIRERAQFFLN